jgi:hypothetical protein
MQELINEAKKLKITELSLDSTKEGKHLYRKYGFNELEFKEQVQR